MRSRSTSALIVLDADGVLVDYLEAYAQAWERAFGRRPALRDVQAYSPRHYWDVPELRASEQFVLDSKGFTEHAWLTMSALPGAVEATQDLTAAGHRLVCVSALPTRFQQARADNLARLGFVFEDVIATGHSSLGNPKREALRALQPLAFVDDNLLFHQALPRTIWRALVDARPNGGPNSRSDLAAPDSRHGSLAEFTAWWLAR
jgi:phosphoglycolate phosphatase-like HAD superfamily hydrolase